MKRFWRAAAVVMGLVAFEFGIAQADTGFSPVFKIPDIDVSSPIIGVVCHVLNTGSLALTQVTITINSESNTQLAIQRFFNVAPGKSVKEDIDSTPFPRNCYCKVSVLNSTSWVGSLEMQILPLDGLSFNTIGFHQQGTN